MEDLDEQITCVHCAGQSEKIVINRKLIIVSVLFLMLFAVSLLPGFEKLNDSFVSYFKTIWWAVLLGIALGGIIDYFISDEFIYSILGQKRKRSLLYAVGLGVLMSACSHGILAISMQIYKKGASIPAVIAFLLASPWANLPMSFLLIGFFGWRGLMFILAAMVIAFITGLVFMLLEKYDLIEKSREVELDTEVRLVKQRHYHLVPTIKGVLQGSLNLTNMVVWWILIGFIAAVLIRTYVPGHVFMQYFGPSIGGLFLTLLFATLIEVCSEGSAPIAFEIFNKVGSFGNPFVFLMAGVVTDYTEIGLIWHNVGKKTALWLPIVTVPQVVGLGIFFNIFL